MQTTKNTIFITGGSAGIGFAIAETVKKLKTGWSGQIKDCK